MLRPLTLIRSKLAMPKPEPGSWLRPRLKSKLEQIIDHPVTVVVAGAGYGKTTAVAQILPLLNLPFAWYSLGPEDASIFMFASYLAGALDSILPGIREGFALDLNRLDEIHWETVLNALLPYLESEQARGALLVLDDCHFLNGVKEINIFLDRFLSRRPDWLRLVILSREEVDIPEISRLGTRGQRLLIQEKDLALDQEEVYEYLSRAYSEQLAKKESKRFYQYSEGWITALKLIAQGVEEGSVSLPIKQLPNSSLDDLFEFLSQDVLARQDRDLQNFLLKSSLLDYLSGSACAAIMGPEFAPELLNTALRKRLFLTELGNGLFRYHNLFRNFLQREATKRLPDWEKLHGQAGYFYLQEGQTEEALQHFLKGRLWTEATTLLEQVASELVFSGRAQVFRSYLDQLPAEFKAKPQFLVALGDAERLASHYPAALELYRQAEEWYRVSSDELGLSQVLKKLGEVYIDTIQPALAEDFLRRAYKTLREEQVEEKAEILGLMAENMLNQGRPNHALRYQRLAREMLHLASRGNLEARLLLRTGRLDAAIQLLESKAAQEKGNYHPPVSFRETPLLLSLLYSFTGDAERALVAAEQGIQLGQKLKSPFVEAIGYARLGHALLVQRGQPTRACHEAYQRAMEINDNLGLVRGRTEVLMGQCLLYGLEGDWLAAKRCGLEGARITEQVRDRWFTAVLYHVLGIAATSSLALQEAQEYLLKAIELFSRSGDSFGKTVAAWWLANIALRQGREEEFRQNFVQVLELGESRGYDFLFQKGTLLGSLDGRASIPLLREAKRLNLQRPYVDWLLNKLGIQEDDIQVVSYTLRIQMLGPFRVWRGEREVASREWRREDARRLFQLLLTKRHTLLHKEEIMTYLWPNANREAAARDFKVALNTLLNVLEPGRLPRSPSFFIQRQGPAYYFNLASGFWLDVEQFEGLATRAEKMATQQPAEAEKMLKRALELYEGDYLEGATQDDWCLEERERLIVIYIRAAELLARLMAGRGDYHNCLQLAEKVLSKDNCWEEAYRLQMYCYGKLNNRAMVSRVYQRCLTVLREELGVAPSLKTTKLYERLLQGVVSRH